MPRRPPRLPPLAGGIRRRRARGRAGRQPRLLPRLQRSRLRRHGPLWAPTGAMVCLHPGQGPLHERAEIMASWRASWPSRVAQGALHRRMGGRPARPRHRGLPRDPGQRPAHGDQHLRAPERRLAHGRPPFRPGAPVGRAPRPPNRPTAGPSARPAQAALDADRFLRARRLTRCRLQARAGRRRGAAAGGHRECRPCTGRRRRARRRTR